MKKDRFEELAEIWFKRAGEDLSWAKNSFKDGYYGGVCFLCQQVAEKCLKAFLFSQKQKLIKTHDLERLLEKCLVFEKNFLKLKKNCQILNGYYIDTRYPDIWDYSRFESEKLAREALKLSEKVLEFVQKRID